MNNIKILGRLTAAPELRQGASGRSFATFIVAVPRQNNRKEADFIRCIAFDKLADALSKHCSKGRQVLLDGRLEVQIVENGNQDRNFFHTVIAQRVEFLHDPSQNQTAGATPF